MNVLRAKRKNYERERVSAREIELDKGRKRGRVSGVEQFVVREIMWSFDSI